MKTGIIIGLLTLFCSQAFGQVIINTDGTHSVQHGPHIIHSNGTVSVQHGPHIIHPNGTISVQHGQHIIQPDGSVAVVHGPTIIHSDPKNAETLGETHDSSTITVSDNWKSFFNLRLGSPADRLDQIDAHRKSQKENEKHKRKLRKLFTHPDLY